MYLEAIEQAIRRRGTQPFTGPELAAEFKLCRQTIYRYIRILNEMGHRIEGEPRMGFMARMKEQKQ
jgi:predicted DNA-binding transcriptional regulator YafY